MTYALKPVSVDHRATLTAKAQAVSQPPTRDMWTAKRHGGKHCCNQRHLPIYCLAIEELSDKTGLDQWLIAEYALALLAERISATVPQVAIAQTYPATTLAKAHQMLLAVGDKATWRHGDGRWRSELARFEPPRKLKRKDGLDDGRSQRATGRTEQKNLRQSWTYICVIKDLAAATGRAESALAEEALMLVQSLYAGPLDSRIPPREARHGC